MSVTAQLRHLTPSQIKEIERNPAAAYALLRAGFDQLGQWGLTMMKRMEEIEARYAEVMKRRGAVQDLHELSEQDQELLAKRKAEYGALHEQFIDKNKKPKLKSASRMPRELDLQKAWHGLHFLLTGVPEGGEPPTADAITGGREIPDRDGIMGYGPARYLTPEQVREVSTALQQVSEKNLAGRFNLDAAIAAKIYAVRDPDDLKDLLFYFRQLKAYYKRAAAKGNGMLLYFT